VKLVASVFCVGVLALVGCVDQETTGGGQLEGIRPAKPSIDNPNNNPEGVNPVIDETMSPKSPIRLRDVDVEGLGTIDGKQLPSEPAPEVCENCTVSPIKLPSERNGIDEVRIVSDGGFELCRIYLNDGKVVVSECDTYTP
jgi:hypothetical protein